ncbi:MAG: substrate-binding domain-containing protein [Oscillospiraceae bacterium]|jgi:ABC-type sugar transport system substrate-binding protein|nr:substrate-binding domain-containing protein [Oscillospiraceae bacterium]
MNRKRSVLSALLALSLVCAACGIRTNLAPEAEEDLIVVGMCQVGAESDWRVANSESMKTVFTEENGYRLLFDDARQKQENQISAVRKFIQQQVDYIVLMPISESGWDSVLQEAKEAEIPVILVDRMVDVADEELYAAHVGSDFRREGAQAVQWIETACPETEDPVRIIHIQGTLGSTAQLGRTAALEEAVARHDSWELLSQLDGDFTQAKTYEVLTEYLSGLPAGQEIDVVYCENDNEAFGAIQALEENGYACGKDSVKVITFDATRNALLECMKGKIALAVECNPLLGPMVERVIQTIEAGQVPVKHHYVEERTFTAGELTEEIIQQREY